MNGRDMLRASSFAGAAVVHFGAISGRRARAATPANPLAVTANPLRPPTEGDIPVAFLISDGAVVIDFAGPWEVFSDVSVPGRPMGSPFRLYTVSETGESVHASGGMTLLPNYSFASVPRPKVLVIPAQADPSAAVIAWVREMTRTADITMSVCTGAFVLAKAGLLSGKPATTHHSAYAELAAEFPDVSVRRGARFVEAGNIASSGGLSSGIDLALRVVERYFGRSVAASTADSMEYQGLGWRDATANAAYAARKISTDQRPLCAVCEMDVDAGTAPKSSYRGRTYRFCSDAHKVVFDKTPDKYAIG